MAQLMLKSVENLQIVFKKNEKRPLTVIVQTELTCGYEMPCKLDIISFLLMLKDLKMRVNMLDFMSHVFKMFT